jgi:hypothetical protein
VRGDVVITKAGKGDPAMDDEAAVEIREALKGVEAALDVLTETVEVGFFMLSVAVLLAAGQERNASAGVAAGTVNAIKDLARGLWSILSTWRSEPTSHLPTRICSTLGTTPGGDVGRLLAWCGKMSIEKQESPGSGRNCRRTKTVACWYSLHPSRRLSNADGTRKS